MPSFFYTPFPVLPPFSTTAYLRYMKFSDMMRAIETGEAFSLRWTTCNLSKGIGGEIRYEESLRLMVKEQEVHAKAGKSQRPKYSYEHSRQYLNIWNEANGRHIRIYKRLIIEFNDNEVVY